MGQINRQELYNKFWLWLQDSIDGYSDAIDMLLRTLTDQQLEQLIAEITEANGFGEEE